MLLFLLKVGLPEESSESDAGYSGHTVKLHNLKLNYKAYSLPEEDPQSVVIIENVTAHNEYSGRQCKTIQYFCNKTGVMSTKL